MSQVEAHFEVPPEITTGLMSGSLERVGGVVRDSSTKQVVAWLRETNVTDNNDASDLMKSVLHATGRGRLITTVGASASMLNLGLSGVTLAIMINRLNDLSKQIDKVIEEFDHDRRVQFQSALEAAKDAFAAEDQQYTAQYVSQAVKGLYEAQNHLFRDFDWLIKDPKPENLSKAEAALVQGFHAAMVRTRCYLAAEQRERAIETLSESLPEFEQCVRDLIIELLSPHQGIYLHPSLPSDTLDRFIELELWLQGAQRENRAAAILEIIRSIQADLWNSEAEKRLDTPSSFFDPVARVATDTFKRFGIRAETNESGQNQSGRDDLLERLATAEMMLENLERLQGMELEIRSLRLATFHEWDEMVEEAAAERDVLLVDTEMLGRVGRLSA